MSDFKKPPKNAALSIMDNYWEMPITPMRTEDKPAVRHNEDEKPEAKENEKQINVSEKEDESFNNIVHESDAIRSDVREYQELTEKINSLSTKLENLERILAYNGEIQFSGKDPLTNDRLFRFVALASILWQIVGISIIELIGNRKLDTFGTSQSFLVGFQAIATVFMMYVSFQFTKYYKARKITPWECLQTYIAFTFLCTGLYTTIFCSNQSSFSGVATFDMTLGPGMYFFIFFKLLLFSFSITTFNSIAAISPISWIASVFTLFQLVTALTFLFMIIHLLVRQPGKVTINFPQNLHPGYNSLGETHMRHGIGEVDVDRTVQDSTMTESPRDEDCTVHYSIDTNPKSSTPLLPGRGNVNYGV